MKMIKRAMALALALLVLLAPMALAEGGQSGDSARVDIQGVNVDDEGNAEILFYTDVSELESIEVTLDGNPASVTDLTPYDRGTSWVFLVDTASVSTRSGPEPIRATLSGLIDMMKSGDNAALLDVSASASDIELVENASTLRAMIDSFKMDEGGGSLGDAVSSALRFLSSGQNVREHTVLVVISDGATFGDEGRSAAEAATLAEDSNTTIYTIAYYSGSSYGDEVLSYLMLSPFSKGGLMLPVKSSREAPDQVLPYIFLNEQRFYLLQTTPAANGANGATLTLRLNDGEDSIPLSEEDQARIQAVIDANAASSTEPQEIIQRPVALPSIQPYVGRRYREGPDWLLYAAIGGCVLAVAMVILLIVVVLRRRGRAGKRPETSPVSMGYTPVGAGGPPTTPGGDAPHQPQEVQVTLASLGSGENRVASFRGGELIVGRDPSRAKLQVSDPKVSGVHLKLRYQGGVLIAEDVSLNGTSVNGERIGAPTPLRQRDVLTMGTSQYRITWWTK